MNQNNSQIKDILLIQGDDVIPFKLDETFLSDFYSPIILAIQKEDCQKRKTENYSNVGSINKLKIKPMKFGLNAIVRSLTKRFDLVMISCDGSKKIKKTLLMVSLLLFRSRIRALLLSKDRFTLITFSDLFLIPLRFCKVTLMKGVLGSMFVAIFFQRKIKSISKAG